VILEEAAKKEVGFCRGDSKVITTGMTMMTKIIIERTNINI